MATEPMTCGCGATRLSDERPDHHAKYWRPDFDNCGCVALWIRANGAVKNESGHCRRCGAPVGFTPDGVPTVGAPYAEVRRALELAAIELTKDLTPPFNAAACSRWANEFPDVFIWRARYEREQQHLAESLPAPEKEE